MSKSPGSQGILGTRLLNDFNSGDAEDSLEEFFAAVRNFDLTPTN